MDQPTLRDRIGFDDEVVCVTGGAGGIGTAIGETVASLGADGALLANGDTVLHAPSPDVDVVDTTGAGDAFNGAFAASWAMQPDLPFADHIRFANRYAALSTEHTGAALAMPDRW
jgi:ribokinase